MCCRYVLASLLLAAPILPQDPSQQIPLPELLLEADDTRVDRSCRIVIPQGLVIEDVNDDGVIQIVADDIRVEFSAGSVLRGAPLTRSWDRMTGIGLRVEGHSGVEIAGMDIRGYRVGIAAERAPGLLIEDLVLLDNFRQRLHSSPEVADDGRDWLDPHHNDSGEWAIRYGAGISIASSKQVLVRRCLVRRGQNGILLDRVEDSLIYDNDCSFLSGWGLALWRSSRNKIMRNALDFCIRGYSHGVYNRGQDSAGLLMFEQCKANIIAKNSITHGGDGVFAFAGREALGQKPAATDAFEYRQAGNARNLFYDNDCSYAAAHGLELTFSFGNRIIGNRFSGNAICGIWGGYSSGMEIRGNRFAENGDAGYGAERGGINIEHGSDNLISSNQFQGDRCGVFLWWDEDKELLTTPWALANGAASEGNRVLHNSFVAVDTVLQLRQVQGTEYGFNLVSDCDRELDLDESSRILASAQEAARPLPDIAAQLPEIAAAQPRGMRNALAGRQNIIMGDWGPWDHHEPMLRTLRSRGSEHLYEFYLGEAMLRYSEPEGDLRLQRHHAIDRPGKPVQLRVSSAGSSVLSYDIPIRFASETHRLRGTIISANWDLRVFAWTVDPREDYPGWLREAEENGLATRIDHLDLSYGNAGPSQRKLSVEIANAQLERDRFGSIASTSLQLPAGAWQITTLSDDGIRVSVDDERIIDNWTWHGPTEDKGRFQLEEDRQVEIRVEHFEIDGYAVLRLDLARLGG